MRSLKMKIKFRLCKMTQFLLCSVFCLILVFKSQTLEWLGYTYQSSDDILITWLIVFINSYLIPLVLFISFTETKFLPILVFVIGSLPLGIFVATAWIICFGYFTVSSAFIYTDFNPGVVLYVVTFLTFMLLLIGLFMPDNEKLKLTDIVKPL